MGGVSEVTMEVTETIVEANETKVLSKDMIYQLHDMLC